MGTVVVGDAIMLRIVTAIRLSDLSGGSAKDAPQTTAQDVSHIMM
jgi:hypothetical protein